MPTYAHVSEEQLERPKKRQALEDFKGLPPKGYQQQLFCYGGINKENNNAIARKKDSALAIKKGFTLAETAISKPLKLQSETAALAPLQKKLPSQIKYQGCQYDLFTGEYKGRKITRGCIYEGLESEVFLYYLNESVKPKSKLQVTPKFVVRKIQKQIDSTEEKQFSHSEMYREYLFTKKIYKGAVFACAEPCSEDKPHSFTMPFILGYHPKEWLLLVCKTMIDPLLMQDMILRVCLNLASAVKGLHAKGIVHGDIKDQNFIMQSHGNTMVSYPIDFAFSRMLGEITSGECNLIYMPLILMNPVKAEYCQDIFMLGSLFEEFFEMYCRFCIRLNIVDNFSSFMKKELTDGMIDQYDSAGITVDSITKKLESLLQSPLKRMIQQGRTPLKSGPNQMFSISRSQSIPSSIQGKEESAATTTCTASVK